MTREEKQIYLILLGWKREYHESNEEWYIDPMSYKQSAFVYSFDRACEIEAKRSGALGLLDNIC
jgi:hypothetical protein